MVYISNFAFVLCGLVIPAVAGSQLLSLVRGSQVDFELSLLSIPLHSYEQIAERALQMRKRLTSRMALYLIFTLFTAALFSVIATGFETERDRIWGERMRAVANGTLVLGPDGEFRVKDGLEFDMSPSYRWINGWIQDK